MDLLFSRSQKRNPKGSIVPLRVGGNVVFKLHAELEPTDAEMKLIEHYFFQDADLVSSDLMADLRRAAQPAWLLGFLGMIAAILCAVILLPDFTQRMSSMQTYFVVAAVILLSPFLGVAIALIMTLVYFFALRERISVGMLLNGGRTFYCHSVVELDAKEAQILDLCRRLHATLEKAKRWGDREGHPIPDGPIFYRPPDMPLKGPSIDKNLYKAGVLDTAYSKWKDDPYGDQPSTPSQGPNGQQGSNAGSGGTDRKPFNSKLLNGFAASMLKAVQASASDSPLIPKGPTTGEPKPKSNTQHDGGTEFSIDSEAPDAVSSLRPGNVTADHNAGSPAPSESPGTPFRDSVERKTLDDLFETRKPPDRDE